MSKKKDDMPSGKREFWIASVPDLECGDRESMVTTYGPYGEGYDNLHVIEYSAFAEAREEIERLREALENISATINSLRRV